MAISIKQKEASKKWYEKNKEVISIKRKGKRKDEHKSYYEKNKEKILKDTKQWAKDNPEKVKLIQRKSRMSNDSKRLFNLVKNRAKNKNLEFNLELSDIIIPKVCPYLETPFIYGDYHQSMSIDRIDSSKGYIKGNIEVISTLANRMKNVASKEQLLIFAKNIMEKFNDI